MYLNCTVFSASSSSGMDMRKRSMDMDADAQTSDECYAQTPAYQESLAYCIKAHCDAEGLPYNEQNKCFQSTSYTSSSLQESLPSQAPTDELPMDAMWLNKTALVNEAMYQEDLATISLFEEIEVDHVSWGYVMNLRIRPTGLMLFRIAIFVVSVAIPLLTGAYLYISSHVFTYRTLSGGLMTTFHANVALPALHGKRNSQPIAWTGYLPSRAMAIWIALYIILNIIASSVGYRSVQPSSFFDTRAPEITAYVANRTGVLSFANMALAMLFSTRNNPLLYLSGWDMTTQLAFHRWSSRVAVLEAVVHSIVYTADYISYKGANTLSTEAAKAYWWWGVIATVAMSLMVGLSSFSVRSRAYEVFLISHIILAILSLLGCWYHIIQRFQKQWGYEVWLYIAFAFWSYDRLLRVLGTIYHALSKKPVAHIEAVNGTNAVLMTVLLQKPLRAGPGKHIYVHFPSLGKFWESHPFTICDWRDGCSRPDRTLADAESRSSDLGKIHAGEGIGRIDDKNVMKHESSRPMPTSQSADGYYIRCLFRTHSGVTRTLRTKLGFQQTLKVPISIDGPYGGLDLSHCTLHTAHTVLCIAGGIGITHAAAFTRQFARERLGDHGSTSKKIMPRCSNFVLAWSVREQGLLDYCKMNLLPNLRDEAPDDETIRYRFWLTDASSSSSVPGPAGEQKAKEPRSQISHAGELVQQTEGRMDVREVIGSVMDPRRRTVVIVCGPGSLSDDVRSEVVTWADKAYVVDLICESFAW